MKQKQFNTTKPSKRRGVTKNPNRPKRKFARGLILAALLSFGAASHYLGVDFGPLGHAFRDEISELSGGVGEIFGKPAPQAPADLLEPSGRLQQTAFKDCPDYFPNRQPPVVPAHPLLREVCLSGFAILHNGSTKTPVFVAQKLNRPMLEQAKSIARTNRFYEEARLPSAHRAKLADYRGSGYSRGHMAPAGDMHTVEAMAQSFSLANIVPQDQVHNAGAWARIERDTRKYVQRAKGDVYVFTGPVYGQEVETVGAGQVRIPQYIYKVVYDPGAARSWVHWHENRPESRATTPIDYETFVSRTGLRLLPEGKP